VDAGGPIQVQCRRPAVHQGDGEITPGGGMALSRSRWSGAPAPAAAQRPAAGLAGHRPRHTRLRPARWADYSGDWGAAVDRRER
jgi:hypothetical protein